MTSANWLELYALSSSESFAGVESVSLEIDDEDGDLEKICDKCKFRNLK